MKISTGAVAFFALMASGTAQAALVVDQQQTNSNGQIIAATVIGQSFTAGLNGVDFAQFSLRSSNGDSKAQVKIFEGVGFAGSLLGTTNVISITNAPYSNYQFDFATRIGLTVGSSYTLKIEQTGGATYNVNLSSGNLYTGGAAIGSAGNISTPNDLRFAVGIDTARNVVAVPDPTSSTGGPSPVAAVPEPAAWAMMMVGFGLVAGAARYRRKSIKNSFA